jgi:diguanylate cyclase (GGDEF)-like protein
VYKTHSNTLSAPRHCVMISRSFLQHYLRKIDIRYRLIISFLLVSLIPLFICGGIFYRESTEAIQKKNGVFEAEVVKQIAQNMRLEMQKNATVTNAPAPALRNSSRAAQQALIAEVQTLRNKIISIELICVVFVLLLSYVVCRSISVPLGRLVGTMKATEDGNYRVRLFCDGNDEIAVLSQKFNEMAGIVLKHREELEALVAARTQALKEANLKLEALSLTDVLTGLANRRRLDEVLGSELRRAIRSSQYLAIIMLDVDFFKKYNDYYGHPAGDDCLRKVADALQACCQRAGDLVARYGGEEFVLIVADADIASTMILAETLREAIEALRLPHCGSEFGYVTVSIGVAVQKPAPDHTAGLILGSADRAMYRAKLLGRNRVVAMSEERAAELLSS